MSARATACRHYDAYMIPPRTRCQQTIYMATYNDQPAEKDDIFKILTQSDRRRTSRTRRRRRLQARVVRRHAELRDVGDEPALKRVDAARPTLG